MYKLDSADLEFLYLGAAHPSGFDERDIAESDVGVLGVGRTLDRLASLKDQKLLEVKNGLFVITDKGTSILWDKDTPMSHRILRLLKIKSLEGQDIAKYLLEKESAVAEELEKMRTAGHIMFTTVRHDDRIVKVCEMTQDGLCVLECAAASLGQPHGVESLLSEIGRKAKDQKNAAKLGQLEKKLRDITEEL